MLKNGDISPAQWVAAIAYRNTYERALGSIVRARLPDGTGRMPRRNPRMTTPTQARLDAVERLQRINSELGEVATRLVEALAIEDECWANIGKRFRVDPKTAKSWCTAALQRLAEVWSSGKAHGGNSP